MQAAVSMCAQAPLTAPKATETLEYLLTLPCAPPARLPQPGLVPRLHCLRACLSQGLSHVCTACASTPIQASCIHAFAVQNQRAHAPHALKGWEAQQHGRRPGR